MPLASSGVFSRPRIALRCGKRPHLATTSRCAAAYLTFSCREMAGEEVEGIRRWELSRLCWLSCIYYRSQEVGTRASVYAAPELASPFPAIPPPRTPLPAW